MAENNFNATVGSLFNGMESFMSTKTVVGEAINVEGTIILPLVDVSFGVGAGTLAGEGKSKAGGAMGGKMSPSAVLVINDGITKLVNVKNQDVTTKILDMIPDIINKFTSKKNDIDVNKDEIKAATEEAVKNSQVEE